MWKLKSSSGTTRCPPQRKLIRRPLLARGHQAAKDMVAGEVSDVLQVDVLQVSNCWWYCTPGMNVLPSSGKGRRILVPASQTIEFNEIPRNSQYPQKSSKWCLETSKDLQNEVPRGTWNHRNHQKIKKVKSNENHCFFYVFERLGHQKSSILPIRNHQESCL